MKPVKTFSSRLVALPMENIDTDQIIPARYLKVTDKAGLGEALFADWRYEPDGSPRPDFPLNQAAARDARILVAGHNFGCGSSREHAPWALLGYGFRAVVSTYFADIFANNALKNGLLPIVVEHEAHARLLALADEVAGAGETAGSGGTAGARRTALPGDGPGRDSPDTHGGVVTVDLRACTLTFPNGDAVRFPIDPFARECLLNGLDQLGFILAEEAAIDRYEAEHPARVRTVG